jgi:hypothetical protein
MLTPRSPIIATPSNQKRVGMRQGLERSRTGAAAPLAILLALLIAKAATAGDASMPQDPDRGDYGRRCGPPGEACARITGYIKAGSDFASGETYGLRLGRVVQAPLFTGAAAIGQGADAANLGMGFLPVSGEDSAR